MTDKTMTLDELLATLRARDLFAEADFITRHLSQPAKRLEAADRDDRQRMPAGWKIEVRYLGDRAGLCVMGPPESGSFAIDGETKDPSSIRAEVIRDFGKAMQETGR